MAARWNAYKVYWRALCDGRITPEAQGWMDPNITRTGDAQGSRAARIAREALRRGVVLSLDEAMRAAVAQVEL